jgi:hypothetical protein
MKVLSLGISLALLEAQDYEKLLVVALIDHFHVVISSFFKLSFELFCYNTLTEMSLLSDLGL